VSSFVCGAKHVGINFYNAETQTRSLEIDFYTLGIEGATLGIASDSAEIENDTSGIESDNAEMRAHMAGIDQCSPEIGSYMAGIDRYNAEIECDMAGIDQHTSGIAPDWREMTSACMETGQTTRFPVRAAQWSISATCLIIGHYSLLIGHWTFGHWSFAFRPSLLRQFPESFDLPQNSFVIQIASLKPTREPILCEPFPPLQSQPHFV